MSCLYITVAIAPGADISTAIQDADKLAELTKATIEFNFNDYHVSIQPRADIHEACRRGANMMKTRNPPEYVRGHGYSISKRGHVVTPQGGQG